MLAASNGTLFYLSKEILTHRTVYRFFYPLALSWIFMVLDGPISVAFLSVLPNARVNTAAFLILMSLAIWIESPIIDLLSTSTTLGKSTSSLNTINRFVIILIAWVTLIHALAVFSPLYVLITSGVLHVEPAVAEAARPGLALMLPWSAFIGWRRSRQGLMIRNGYTKAIGIGTFARVCVLLAVDIWLSRTPGVNGITLAASGLMASVATEAIFIHFASRPVIALIRQSPPNGEAPLTMIGLFKFHVPLTATTMVKLLTSPVIAAGLARTVDSTKSLAAFEVASTVLFVFRGVAFCLPEVVISLYKSHESRAVLRRFSLSVGAGASLLVVILALFRGDIWIFEHLLHTESALAETGHWMFLASAAAPFLDAANSYVLGLLTAHHLTIARMVGVMGSSLAFVGAVIVCVALKSSGEMLAGCAITAGLGLELAILFVWWRKVKPSMTDLGKRIALAEDLSPVVAQA